MACILVQRRKAAIQEGVKKFHLCLCLVSIVQMHSLLFVLFSASETRFAAVLFGWLFHQSTSVSNAMLVWLVLSHEHNAYPLAQAFDVFPQLSAREIVGAVDTVHSARTPQRRTST